MKTSCRLPLRHVLSAAALAAVLLPPSARLIAQDEGGFGGGDFGGAAGGGAGRGGGGGGGGSTTFSAPPLAANPSPTAQGRLVAARRALEQARDALARTNVAAGESSATSLARARATIAAALEAVDAAAAFVAAHPELDRLPAGPAPAEKLAVRSPTLTQRGRAAPASLNLFTALDALNLALNEFQNNPAPTYTGPVIGELGGHREKVMTRIQAAAVEVVARIGAAQNSSGATSVAVPAAVEFVPLPAATR